jgi:hypothetical protein
VALTTRRWTSIPSVEGGFAHAGHRLLLQSAAIALPVSAATSSRALRNCARRPREKPATD